MLSIRVQIVLVPSTLKRRWLGLGLGLGRPFIFILLVGGIRAGGRAVGGKWWLVRRRLGTTFGAAIRLDYRGDTGRCREAVFARGGDDFARGGDDFADDFFFVAPVGWLVSVLDTWGTGPEVVRRDAGDGA